MYGKPVKIKIGLNNSGKYSVKNVEWRDFDGTFWILSFRRKGFNPSKLNDMRFLSERFEFMKFCGFDLFRQKLDFIYFVGLIRLEVL